MSNKNKIKIFDKNFKPNITMSSKGIPKYIEWEFVKNPSTLNETDVVIYTDQCLTLAKKHKVGKKIAWILEPPVIHKYPYDYINDNNDEFNVIMNFCNDFIKKHQNSIYIPNILSFIDPCEQKIYEKTKLVSLIFSNKSRSKNHKFRKEIVGALKSNSNVDMYGAMVDNFVENKIDALKDYMYHIVVENCNIDGYYSEKTLDCFSTGTVPIIYGTSCICNVYDKNGMFFFDSIDELHYILSTLSKDVYKSKLEFINKNYELSKKYPVVEDYIYENHMDLFKIGS